MIYDLFAMAEKNGVLDLPIYIKRRKKFLHDMLDYFRECKTDTLRMQGRRSGEQTNFSLKDFQERIALEKKFIGIINEVYREFTQQ